MRATRENGKMGNRREFLRMAALGAAWPALAWGQAKGKKPEGKGKGNGKCEICR